MPTFDSVQVPAVLELRSDRLSVSFFVRGVAISRLVVDFEDDVFELFSRELQIVVGDEAIQRASEVMTLRQGDLIFIDRTIASRPLQREEVLSVTIDNEELLYCKVK